jgi:hypothetical protein
VYAGDSEIPAHIMKENEDSTKYDKDRILSGIPKEKVLYDAFDANIELALQEKAGISVVSNSQFFNPAYTINRFNIKKSYDDIVMVDFFDQTDILIDTLKEDIQLLPDDKYLFGRLDLGISHDNAGFALGYIKDMKVKDVNGMSVVDTHYAVPIAIAISRYPGQETAIHKIKDLILQIHSIRPFFLFTTDQFQSSQLRQDLTLAGITTELLSVDRTTNPYTVFKNLLYEGKIDLPECDLLKDELLNLQNYGNKVDHTATSTKDVADAVSGLVFSMSKADPSALDIPAESNPYIHEAYSNMIESWYDNLYKSRIENIARSKMVR